MKNITPILCVIIALCLLIPISIAEEQGRIMFNTGTDVTDVRFINADGETRSIILNCVKTDESIAWTFTLMDPDDLYDGSLYIQYENGTWDVALEELFMGYNLIQEGRAAEAIPYLLAGAKLGSFWDAYLLGECYEYGKGVKADEDIALAWYESAAEAGLPEAMNAAGYLCFWNGSYEKAVHWLTMAVENGNIDAMINLGALYINGNGIGRDPKYGAQLILQAARSGNPTGMYTISKLYENGIGVEQDAEKALEWRNKAVEAGY